MITEYEQLTNVPRSIAERGLSTITKDGRPNREYHPQYHSQVLQDMFICQHFAGKLHGTYLEIGAGDPIAYNNTYVLESRFHWIGTSIDCRQQPWANRKNPFHCADATQLDYSFLGKGADYLSLDADINSWAVLRLLLDFEFGVITFEHDAYGNNGTIRDMSRCHLATKYDLVLPDVEYLGNPMEDWWVLK